MKFVQPSGELCISRTSPYDAVEIKLKLKMNFTVKESVGYYNKKNCLENKSFYTAKKELIKFEEKSIFNTILRNVGEVCLVKD